MADFLRVLVAAGPGRVSSGSLMGEVAKVVVGPNEMDLLMLDRSEKFRLSLEHRKEDLTGLMVAPPLDRIEL